MYTLIKNIPAKKLYTRELPALAASLVIAEFYFKFGSFILECGAFLGTWWLISFILTKINFPRS
jgi:hypothetical protein